MPKRVQGDNAPKSQRPTSPQTGKLGDHSVKWWKKVPGLAWLISLIAFTPKTPRSYSTERVEAETKPIARSVPPVRKEAQRVGAVINQEPPAVKKDWNKELNKLGNAMLQDRTITKFNINDSKDKKLEQLKKALRDARLDINAIDREIGLSPDLRSQDDSLKRHEEQLKEIEKGIESEKQV